MELIQHTPELSAYLAAGEAIDHEHSLVRGIAVRLTVDHPDAYSYAKAAFELVRDTIAHSADVGDARVPWRASEVLQQGVGTCYVKSHALVALLRARSVPAALCYQRLAEEDGSDPVIHGLVAVRLPGRGVWARQDPRGNKPGIDAQFAQDRERLAFSVRPEFNEVDYPVLYAEPHPVVLNALQAAPDRAYLWKTLPTEL
ncbi:transglutaminase-like domain-containing protein [Streptomyces sp. NRRL S-118]|uniref:transglutaminase-like domain-containing protein n=1 Tax=Streptomyces sp. NRRL S-118 TaxID=1463881 RepID=UPI0004CC80B5|nr:transglutaminase family protein [Streptomyces sp. NRRL S-118]